MIINMKIMNVKISTRVCVKIRYSIKILYARENFIIRENIITFDIIQIDIIHILFARFENV